MLTAGSSLYYPSISLCFSMFYLHITATFVEGFVTRREDAPSDNSCLGIS